MTSTDPALAELGALHPDNPAVPRVRAGAVDWQAALDTKRSLLAAGDLVAANRVDRAQVDPGFDRLAWLLRTTAAGADALVKGCSGTLVLDTIEQAWASRSGGAFRN